MPVVPTRSGGEYAALLGRPRYRSFVLTVSLSRITSAMFMTSGVLLVLGRTGSAGLAGLTAAASMLPGALSGPAQGLRLRGGSRLEHRVGGDQPRHRQGQPRLDLDHGGRPDRAHQRAGDGGADHDPEVQAGGLDRARPVLANFSWGLMTIAFPLYAAQQLHAGAHASGYLWAAVALGSILGTFGLAGTPSARRVGLSYAALGLSALLWPLAGTLLIGFLLITLTGFIEGPAYSGTIALRQRHVPAAVRGQVFNTLGSFGMGAASLGSAVGGLLQRPVTTILAFTGINLVAAVIASRARLEPDATVRIPDTPAGG